MALFFLIIHIFTCAVEFNGLMPWNLNGEVTETSNDTDDGLIPWGTPAQREAAEQALVRHFAY